MKGFTAVIILALAAAGATASDAENRPRRLLQRSPAATHMAPAAEPAKEASFVEVKAEGQSRLSTVLSQLQKTSLLYLAQQAYEARRQAPTTGGAVAQESGFDRFFHWVAVVVSMFAWVIIATVVAYLYQKNKEAPLKDPNIELNVESFKEFRHGLFTCFEDPETCLLATLCPALRWARTASFMGTLGFWAAFATFIGIDFIAGITGEVLVYCVLAGFLTYYRQEMRKAFDMRRVGGITFAEDCMSYCWCLCCTVTQEARHVEDAMKAGHPAVPGAKKDIEA